eukprot:CAMPEP_0174860698 /NCGR_PEP_ID=MMETSP1114-20130205/49819_1 /TAXON_ID=312471 /ORGANISM="Neobodo designis, Strain CCAP 1951/1" /LENGTH=285 /DNA_ID=CAMNT_0016095683 /DNA_START=55 /DNA_END=908 /DNA_ORIENTATION=-
MSECEHQNETTSQRRHWWCGQARSIRSIDVVAPSHKIETVGPRSGLGLQPAGAVLRVVLVEAGRAVGNGAARLRPLVLVQLQEVLQHALGSVGDFWHEGFEAAHVTRDVLCVHPGAKSLRHRAQQADEHLDLVLFRRARLRPPSCSAVKEVVEHVVDDFLIQHALDEEVTGEIDVGTERCLELHLIGVDVILRQRVAVGVMELGVGEAERVVELLLAHVNDGVADLRAIGLPLATGVLHEVGEKVGVHLSVRLGLGADRAGVQQVHDVGDLLVGALPDRQVEELL